VTICHVFCKCILYNDVPYVVYKLKIKSFFFFCLLIIVTKLSDNHSFWKKTYLSVTISNIYSKTGRDRTINVWYYLPVSSAPGQKRPGETGNYRKERLLIHPSINRFSDFHNVKVIILFTALDTCTTITYHNNPLCTSKWLIKKPRRARLIDGKDYFMCIFLHCEILQSLFSVHIAR
jgi:hypothetical protein